MGAGLPQVCPLQLTGALLSIPSPFTTPLPLLCAKSTSDPAGDGRTHPDRQLPRRRPGATARVAPVSAGHSGPPRGSTSGFGGPPSGSAPEMAVTGGSGGRQSPSVTAEWTKDTFGVFTSRDRRNGEAICNL